MSTFFKQALTLNASLLAGLLAVGCVGAKGDVDEDFSDLAGIDEKSDAFSGKMKLLGTLKTGEMVGPVAYQAAPKFRAYKFKGATNLRVDIWVRSEDGDAIAWLLDSSFKTLAKNDDDDSKTQDSHIEIRLPKRDDPTFYIVFRELDLQAANFTVELGGEEPVEDLEFDTFKALSPLEKFNTLYPECEVGNHDDGGCELADGFAEVEIRMVDTLEGDVLDRALAEYTEFRNWSFENGGGKPTVNAIVKGGVTFGYNMTSCGSGLGDWDSTYVYDYEFQGIGDFGYSE